MATKHFEFGLDSFVPISLDESGQELSGDVVIRNTIEEAVLADAVGIDSFNIAEHYRSDMMDSAGHVILAAIAARTERIRLGTAVTVLSTQDPVRVYTEFATLDAVSNGRAQLIVGRGSLTESFPLFGYDVADFEEIFEEKLELLTRLLRDQPVTWSGKFRSPLTNQSVSPPLPEGHLPTWVAVWTRGYSASEETPGRTSYRAELGRDARCGADVTIAQCPPMTRSTRAWASLEPGRWGRLSPAPQLPAGTTSPSQGPVPSSASNLSLRCLLPALTPPQPMTSSVTPN